MSLLLELLQKDHARNVVKMADGKKFRDTVEKLNIDMKPLEVLMAMDPKYTTGLVETGTHVEFVLEKCFSLGMKPTLSMYNSIMSQCEQIHQRLAVLADMHQDGIKPSIYTYSLIYENLFETLMVRKPDLDEDIPKIIEYKVVSQKCYENE